MKKYEYPCQMDALSLSSHSLLINIYPVYPISQAHIHAMNLKWLEAWLDMDEGMDGMIECVVI